MHQMMLNLCTRTFTAMQDMTQRPRDHHRRQHHVHRLRAGRGRVARRMRCLTWRPMLGRGSSQVVTKRMSLMERVPLPIGFGFVRLQTHELPVLDASNETTSIGHQSLSTITNSSPSHSGDLLRSTKLCSSSINAVLAAIHSGRPRDAMREDSLSNHSSAVPS